MWEKCEAMDACLLDGTRVSRIEIQAISEGNCYLDETLVIWTRHYT
jgi:hypothetical protein